MKKWLSLMLVAVMILLCVTGCNSSEGGDPSIQSSDQASEASQGDESDPTNEPITLRIMWWGSQTRHDATMKVLDMFTEKYPNVTFQAEFSAQDGYFEKLNTLVAANDAPDIFQNGIRLQTYVDHIEPLDEYIESGIIDISGTNDILLAGGQYEGKQLGISLGSNAMMVVYDPELFRQAGLEEPSENWTWEEFEKDCMTIKEKLGIYGVSSMEDYWFCGYYINQAGNGEQDLFNDTATGLGYTDDSLVEDYYAMKLRLVEAGAYPDPGKIAEITDIEGDLIVSGEAAMKCLYSNQFVTLLNATDRPLSIATVPRINSDGPSGAFAKTSQLFHVAKNSEYKTEAMTFLNFFVNDIEANKVLAAERGVPIMSQVREALRPIISEDAARTFDYFDLISEIASRKEPGEPAGMGELQELLTTTLAEGIAFKQITPAEAAVKLREDATEIFNRTNP